MSLYLNPRGRSTYGIAICGRCSRKFFLDQLSPDPNAEGLMVCRQDLDDYDPWRLPAPEGEAINLPFVRPDEPLVPGSSADTSGLVWYGVRLPWIIGGWL